jgi:hypothetical protein
MKFIKGALFVLAAMAATNLVLAEELHTFKRIQLSDQFWSEGANFGDLNRDGVNDIISGPWWWEGPEFKTRHEFYPATATFKLKLGPMTDVDVPGFEGTLGKDNKYSDNFFAWALDFNKDGWNDILVIGFPGRDTSWFENPKGKETHWVRHRIFDQTDNESPTFADLTGDGKPELVCITKGQYGYAEPDWQNPAKPWRFHPISPNNKYGNFTHGMGLGDVNGDGRSDLLEKNGWWEQPASLAGDPVWTFHKQPMGAGGSQMHAYDVNGDGLKDIVTGKRFWSHGRTGDPDRNDAAVLYWFKLARAADKSVDFIPYLIDNESGVGTQVVAGDINGDGLPDIVVGNKRGTFVHLHQKKTVPRDEWEKAQPKPFSPPQEQVR